jgi:hypothetical protein
MNIKSKSPKQQSQRQKKSVLKSFNKTNQYDYENSNRIIEKKNVGTDSSISNSNYLLIANHVITHATASKNIHHQQILAKNPVNVILNNSVVQPLYLNSQSSNFHNQNENLIQNNNILNSYWHQNQKHRIDDDEMKNQI